MHTPSESSYSPMTFQFTVTLPHAGDVESNEFPPEETAHQWAVDLFKDLESHYLVNKMQTLADQYALDRSEEVSPGKRAILQATLKWQTAQVERLREAAHTLRVVTRG